MVLTLHALVPLITGKIWGFSHDAAMLVHWNSVNMNNVYSCAHTHMPLHPWHEKGPADCAFGFSHKSL